MAKSLNTKQLLGATDPERLRHIAIGTFLSFFVFLGSFLTADATIEIFMGESFSFLASTRCSACHSDGPSEPAPHDSAGDIDANGNINDPYYPSGWDDPSINNGGYFYNDTPIEDYPGYEEVPGSGGGDGGDGSGSSGGDDTSSSGGDLNVFQKNCLSKDGCTGDGVSGY